MSTERKLDGALRAWAGRHRMDEHDLTDLSDQIHRAVRRSGASKPAMNLAVFGRPKLVAAAAGAIATYVLVSILVQPLPPMDRFFRPSTDNRAAAEIAAITARQVSATTRFISEVDRAFPEGVRWVERQDGHSAITASERSYDDRLAGECVMLRLTLVAQTGDEPWRLLDSRELVATPDAVIDCKLEGAVNGAVTLWSHILPDGLAVVETRVTLSEPLDLEADISTVLEPGIPEKVLAFAADDTFIRLYLDLRRLQLSAPTTSELL